MKHTYTVFLLFLFPLLHAKYHHIMRSLQKKCNAHRTLLLIDANTFNKLPLRSFRIIYNNIEPLIQNGLPTQGITKLHASGSAQFTPGHFKKITKKIRKLHENNLLYIVDLRQEFHGFVESRNNTYLPLCWYKSSMNCINWNKERHVIKDAELEELQHIAMEGITSLYIKDTDKWPRFGKPISILPSKSCSLYVKNILTEKQFITQQGARYKRFYVPDHQAPMPQEVDAFVDFIKNIPANAWLHFHCRAGAGRTTTFLTLYDMFYNADTLTADDIIKRQCLLNNYNLTHLKKDPIMRKLKKNRLTLLHNFYQYVREQSPHFNTHFSQWVSRHT